MREEAEMGMEVGVELRIRGREGELVSLSFGERGKGRRTNVDPGSTQVKDCRSDAKAEVEEEGGAFQARKAGWMDRRG